MYICNSNINTTERMEILCRLLKHIIVNGVKEMAPMDHVHFLFLRFKKWSPGIYRSRLTFPTTELINCWLHMTSYQHNCPPLSTSLIWNLFGRSSQTWQNCRTNMHTDAKFLSSETDFTVSPENNLPCNKTGTKVEQKNKNNIQTKHWIK